MLSTTDAAFLNGVRPDIIQFFGMNGWDIRQENWPTIMDHWWADTVKSTYPHDGSFADLQSYVNAVRAGTAPASKNGGVVMSQTYSANGLPTPAPEETEANNFLYLFQKHTVSVMLIGGLLFYLLFKPSGSSSWGAK